MAINTVPQPYVTKPHAVPPSIAELVDLGHRISAEQRRVSESVDGLLDMYLGPVLSNGGDEIEWAKRGGEGGAR